MNGQYHHGYFARTYGPWAYRTRAYHTYRLIDPHKPSTLRLATRFKKEFCWQGVRIHFVGVWCANFMYPAPYFYELTLTRDTVSSVGIFRRDVRINASTTGASACHFRHALALDERRVKFLPEYFSDMYAHESIERLRRKRDMNHIDVKEVWFAGCHSDVYVIYRLHTG